MVRSVQVIGAGFGRTGTLSLKEALEQLGFGPAYHMQEAMKRPAHVRQWLSYADTGQANWDTLFATFESGVDYPVCNVWEELAVRFPEAKIILTVRDPQRWYDSTQSTIYGFREAFAPWFQRAVPAAGRFVEMVERFVWAGVFEGRFLERDHTIEIFNRHIEHVVSTCPPERLLVFDVAEGWEPLCDFLDVPVPDRPFPHLNDSTVTQRAVAFVHWGTRALPVAGAALAAGLLARARN